MVFLAFRLEQFKGSRRRRLDLRSSIVFGGGRAGIGGSGAGVTDDNMEVVLIEKSQTMVDDTTFFEVVLWHLPGPVPGSAHSFKYRLALVVGGECVLRYDNERGKAITATLRAAKNLWSSHPGKRSTMPSKPTCRGS